MTKAFFKSLFDNNFDALRNYLYFRTGDKNLATDIAQECFLKLWEKQPRGDAATIKRLLYKIGHDLFISSYRHLNVEKNFIINQNNTNATSLSPEDVLNYSELEKKYKKHWKKCPKTTAWYFL